PRPAVSVYAAAYVGAEDGRAVGAVFTWAFAIIAVVAVLAAHAGDPHHRAGAAVAAGAALGVQGGDRDDVGFEGAGVVGRVGAVVVGRRLAAAAVLERISGRLDEQRAFAVAQFLQASQCGSVAGLEIGFIRGGFGVAAIRGIENMGLARPGSAPVRGGGLILPVEEIGAAQIRQRRNTHDPFFILRRGDDAGHDRAVRGVVRVGQIGI